MAGVPWKEAVREKTLRGMRDATPMMVVSDVLLRVSEMVAIDAGDIEQNPDGSAVLHVRLSKTDQERLGVACYVGHRTVEGRLSGRSVRSIVAARCGRSNNRVSGFSQDGFGARSCAGRGQHGGASAVGPVEVTGVSPVRSGGYLWCGIGRRSPLGQPE